MARANLTRPLALLVTGAVLAAGAAARGDADKAREMLLLSMRRAFSLNVEAILVQQAPDGCTQQVKLAQSRDGMLCRTILAPLSAQGSKLIDDGRRAIAYNPDNRVIIDQASSRDLLMDTDRRMSLILRNYTLSLGPNDRIAGRKAVCVVATPKSDGLHLRRFYLDSETGYLLRLETQGPGNDVNTPIDTKSIKFPNRFPTGTFSIQSVGGVRTVRYDSPEKLHQPEGAVEKLGFQPLVPRGLPLGFSYQSFQVTDSDDSRSFVVRISDGLVRATVYQWKGRPTGNKGSAYESEGQAPGGIGVMVFSDLPKSARDQILAAFLREGRGTRIRERSNSYKDFRKDGRRPIGSRPSEQTPTPGVFYWDIHRTWINPSSEWVY